jgi:rare lipoprotein A
MNIRQVVTWLLLCAALLVGAGCENTASPERETQATPTEASVTVAAQEQSSGGAESAHTEEGRASFYAKELEGGTTASGETYRSDALTAAHRTLAFGTKVKVTNLDNGKSVEVVINDRGPHAEGVIIDVSYSAAQALDMIDAGIVRARIEVVDN